MSVVARIELYRDDSGDWRWRALAGNGEIVAVSGEGYRNRQHGERMALELFPDAPPLVVLD